MAEEGTKKTPRSGLGRNTWAMARSWKVCQGPEGKNTGRLQTAKTGESRDAQIGVGTDYEELCITCQGLQKTATTEDESNNQGDRAIGLADINQ